MQLLEAEEKKEKRKEKKVKRKSFDISCINIGFACLVFTFKTNRKMINMLIRRNVEMVFERKEHIVCQGGSLSTP